MKRCYACQDPFEGEEGEDLCLDCRIVSRVNQRIWIQVFVRRTLDRRIRSESRTRQTVA